MPGQVLDRESLKLIQQMISREWHRIMGGQPANVQRRYVPRKETALGTGAIAAGSTTTAANSTSVVLVDMSTDGTLSATTNAIVCYNTGSSMSSTQVYPIFRDFKSSLWCVAQAEGAAPYKALVRFTLSSTLGLTDASATAAITSTDQFGSGSANASTTITVYNVTGSTQMFSGVSGAIGLAFHDSSDNYRIIQMDCT